MSTKMDEDDWKHTLAVFRACLPRRGRKAEDDRRFLEALHFFTWRRSLRRASLRNPARYRARHSAARRHLRQRLRQQGQLDAARARGIGPVIPHKANEKNKPAFFARTLYKARARIEQGVGRLKRFKRVALRCEKTERNFRSIVSFAAGLCLIKFVHTD